MKPFYLFIWSFDCTCIFCSIFSIKLCICYCAWCHICCLMLFSSPFYLYHLSFSTSPFWTFQILTPSTLWQRISVCCAQIINKLDFDSGTWQKGSRRRSPGLKMSVTSLSPTSVNTCDVNVEHFPHSVHFIRSNLWREKIWALLEIIQLASNTMQKCIL